MVVVLVVVVVVVAGVLPKSVTSLTGGRSLVTFQPY